MVPGIDPRVDIVFRKVFGTPEWRELTVSLINAVLQSTSTRRVVDLELLNPYSRRIRPTDKLTILDLKARDTTGCLFNVEMQMELAPSLPQRLLYYWARLYAQQLAQGDDYRTLCATISICFLDACMFPEHPGYHSVFRLLERDRGVHLSNHLEMHVIELPKFARDVEHLQEPLDLWVFFLNNGVQLDADALPTPLAATEIRQAMEVLKVFSQDEMERELYESRLKAERDHRDFLFAREEAIREREEAIRERKEAIQEIRRRLARQVQLCERLLGVRETSTEALMAKPDDELRRLAEQLEQRLPRS